jgi:outer membrane protein assembly factor BamB
MTSPILSDVAVDDGVLYFGINNGVYALDAQTFEKEEIKEKDELISKNVLMVFIVLLIILGIFLILFSIYGNKKRKE